MIDPKDYFHVYSKEELIPMAKEFGFPPRVIECLGEDDWESELEMLLRFVAGGCGVAG